MNCRARFLLLVVLAALGLPAYAHTSTPSKKHHKHALRAPQAGPLYRSRADVMLQADALAARRGLDRQWVRHAIGQARFIPAIARAILPPAQGTPKNWNAYRDRFIEPQRIAAGVRFWQANAATLARAQAETGVPASVIVGIVGIETLYGRDTGSYRVMDALCTLAFDFPLAHPRARERQALFLAELEAFLVLTQRTHTDPLALRGSYAGAMGLPQFMPSSWDKYAVDYDGDGHIDLFHSADDVIGSVAHYFQSFHWVPGLPMYYTVQFDPATLDLPALLAPDIRPTFSAAEMRDKGVLLDGNGNQHTGPLALVELQNGSDAPLYIAGTENFYAITRYNWSSYYALAVIQLGQAVADAMPAPLDMPK